MAIAQSANASAIVQATHVIGVDDQAVYLLDEATGGILRAAKLGPG
jgi:hypothetical protein